MSVVVACTPSVTVDRSIYSCVTLPLRPAPGAQRPAAFVCLRVPSLRRSFLRVVRLPLFGVALALLALLMGASSGPATAFAAAPFDSFGALNLSQAQLLGDAACAQPPASADLTTLSPTKLAYYGLQQRPSDTSRLTRWRQNLSHAKHRYCAVHQRLTDCTRPVRRAPRIGLATSELTADTMISMLSGTFHGCPAHQVLPFPLRG